MKTFYTIIIALGAFLFTACNSNTSDKKHAEVQKTEVDHSMVNHSSKDEHAMLGVKGKCEMCKERIETAAKSVKGVSTAHWDIEKQELHLNFDPAQTSTDAISKAVAKVGHDTEKDEADKATYDALPDCCKYR